MDILRSAKTWISGLLLVLALCVSVPGLAKAQGTSQIDVIQFQDSTGNPIKSYASPFKFRCGAGLTCTALVGNIISVEPNGTGFVPTSRTLSTTPPLAGGGDLSGNRTFSIAQAGGSSDGYLSSPDWTTFNAKLPNPLTTLGDILYQGASIPARLGGTTSLTRKFLSQTGDGVNSAIPVWIQPVESDLALTDLPTNNVTTVRHGFTPKLDNISTHFLNGQGNYVTVTSGAAAGYISQSFSGVTSVNVVHNLNGYPVVAVLDGANAEFIPQSITYNSVNDLTVAFSASLSGTVVATLGSPGIPNVSIQVANYTITATDNTILSNGQITITLPTAVGIAGRSYTVKRIYAGGKTTLATTLSQTIDGSTTLIMASQYDSITIVSDGANWDII